MLYYIENENGEAVGTDDIDSWAQWVMENNRRVAVTHLSDDVYVSTVFLAIDHCCKRDGLPILYETLVLGGPMDGEMDRYSTRTMAVIGHARMVACVKAESVA